MGLALAGLWGCEAAPRGDEFLIVPPERYGDAFDAAVAAARDAGLPPAVRDRGAGLIETQTKVAGSLFEPWLFGEESLDQAAENTILFQRRRARIEFTVPSQPLPPIRDADEPLPGASVPGRHAVEPLDVASADEPLEVRVKVYLERAFVPGRKLSTYSRTLSTTYTDPLRRERETWTPVGRDAEWESRILADLGRRMSLQLIRTAEPEPTQDAPATQPDEPLAVPLEEPTPQPTDAGDGATASGS